MKRRLKVHGPDLEVGDFIVECEVPETGEKAPWNIKVVDKITSNRGQSLLYVMRDSYKDRVHVFLVEREEQENEFGPVTP